jgi:hypothetical protein
VLTVECIDFLTARYLMLTVNSGFLTTLLLGALIFSSAPYMVLTLSNGFITGQLIQAANICEVAQAVVSAAH